MDPDAGPTRSAVGVPSMLSGISVLNLSHSVGKPMILSAFGIVSQNNTASFIPFNQSVTPSVEETTPSANGVGVQAVNATDMQQVQAYSQWITCS